MKNVKYKGANFYKSVFTGADMSTIISENVYFKKSILCKTIMKDVIIIETVKINLYLK